MITKKSNIYPLLLTTFFLCGMLLANNNVRAQEVEFSEEIIEAEDTSIRFQEKYNYLIRADKEEKGLVRITLLRVPGFPVPGFGYEHKLRPAISVFADAGARWGIQTDTIGGFSISSTGIRGVEIEGGVRYYYNIVKRIKKGKSANNFSANYLAYHTFLTSNTEDNDININIYPAVVYGIQRRLGDYGFFDFNVGLKTNFNNSFSIDGIFASFKLGIGL